jgi:hypothetical protein
VHPPLGQAIAVFIIMSFRELSHQTSIGSAAAPVSSVDALQMKASAATSLFGEGVGCDTSSIAL